MAGQKARSDATAEGRRSQCRWHWSPEVGKESIMGWVPTPASFRDVADLPVSHSHLGNAGYR